jgi:hypothetical protein
MVFSPVGLLVWGPLAVEYAREIVSGVRVNLACAAWFVWCLAAGDACLVASEVLKDLAQLDRLAVVGQGASSPGVVCALNHGFSSFGWLCFAKNPAPARLLCFAFGIGVAVVWAISPGGAQD